MRSTLSKRLRGIARYLETPSLWQVRQQGIDVNIFEKLNCPWLRSYDFATVLDIGANVGQFARAAHAVWPQAQIYSFEPLPDCLEQLKRQMAHVKKFKAFPVGLGDSAGEFDFCRNRFSASSSFLQMNETHKTAFPHTSRSDNIKVRVERLDDLACSLNLVEPILVKIDVQGFEDRVLKGGEQIIKRAKIIITETSLNTLYQGQPLFAEIHNLMAGYGFVYAGALDQLSDPTTGRILQTDSVFIKRS